MLRTTGSSSRHPAFDHSMCVCKLCSRSPICHCLAEFVFFRFASHHIEQRKAHCDGVRSFFKLAESKEWWWWWWLCADSCSHLRHALQNPLRRLCRINNIQWRQVDGQVICCVRWKTVIYLLVVSVFGTMVRCALGGIIGGDCCRVGDQGDPSVCNYIKYHIVRRTLIKNSEYG